MADERALRSQLAALEAQRDNLGVLVGDDEQSPLIPLQRELAVAIDGIHERLSMLQKGEQGQAAAEAAAADTASLAPSSLPREEESIEEGGDGNDKPDPPVLSATSTESSSSFSTGDCCLAPRVFDRRYARAVVEEALLPGRSGICLVTWLYPRHKGELVCRYWKENRNCKFSGPDCPFSHGVEVSLSDLLPPDDLRWWETSSPGTITASAGSRRSSRGGSRGGGGGDGDGDDKQENAAALKDWNIPGSTVDGADGGSSSGVGAWLSSLHAGSRVLARYHDRVWYEATAEGPAVAGLTVGVRFKGFEDDGLVHVPADGSHLAPLETNESATAASGRGSSSRSRRGGGEGGGDDAEGSSDEEESDFQDAWANDARGGACGDADSAEKFFQERVLGDRRGGTGVGGSSTGEVSRGEDGGKEGGLCSDAYVFGDWEQHTKGFGSRMMNRMGYRRGEGLGKEKQGISRPVPIRVLPERRALDHLRVDDGGGKSREDSLSGSIKIKTKKKSKARGGSDQGGDGSSGSGSGGMFNFLNNTIHASMKKGKATAVAGGGDVDGRRRLLLAGRRLRPGGGAASSSSSSTGAPSHPLTKTSTAAPGGRGKGRTGAATASDMSQSELRSHLVQAREAEATLAAKIGRLQETIARNTERDPRMAAQARQKLEEVRTQANEIRASRERAERALGNRGLDGAGSGKGGKKGRSKGGMFSF